MSTPTHPKNWLTVFDEYVIILAPERIVPVDPNPTVLSTVITEDPTDTGLIFAVFGWISNVPSIKSLSSKPTNRPNLKYVLIPDLVNISTSETDAWVSKSDSFLIVWPTSLSGSPDILSATTISLLKNSADDGFGKYCSKSMTFGTSPNNTLNNILNDSSVPFAS